MSNTALKNIGMGLFVFAVATFLALTFVIDISFKDKVIGDLLEDKNKDLVNVINQLDPAPTIPMKSSLSEVFNTYNLDVADRYGVSPSASENFMKTLHFESMNYDSAAVVAFFGEETVISKSILENTSWMMGREWMSFNEFETSFTAKISDVNQAIISEYGISLDRQKSTLLNLMTVGSPLYLKTGWLAFVIFGMGALGGFIYFIPLWRKQPGIKNNHIYHNKGQTRKWPAMVVFALLVTFYIILYHFPYYLANQISLLKPLSEKLSGNASDEWFLYGFLYTLTMFVMGIRMMLKYRGNKYQQVRTSSVFFFQVAFAFTLPQILTRMQLPAYDLKSAWPLEYSFFFDYRIDEYLQNGTLGMFLFGWGVVLFAIGVPVLTYFYGKRWYCSWVCGCGGLAETVGDPYRHLSDKRLGAWKIERWLVHGVLVFAVFMTAWVVYTSFSGQAELLGVNSYSVRSTYGFFIGFVFAGAVGTGFYPIMGNRTWCRFGCPLAAYLGFVQRFKSRFRITTNGAQCISCGNCSTQCEMGIDVRWYAQRGQNIVRSSCVGCGVCAAVCPRGVLKLENTDEQGRINDNPILIGRDGASLNI